MVIVMLYTLIVGWSLLSGITPPERGYLLMVAPCLAPLLWSAYGFVCIQESKQNTALLLSAVGWVIVALALVVKHAAIVRAGDDAYAGDAGTFATPVCIVMAVMCLGLSLYYGWQGWMNVNQKRSS